MKLTYLKEKRCKLVLYDKFTQLCPIYNTPISHARVLYVDIEDHLTNTSSSKLKHINWDRSVFGCIRPLNKH